MNCHDCNKYLEKVFEQGKDDEQRENSLVIHFRGGYGMFIDPFGDETTNRVSLCHDCAHELCEKVPWIKHLLQPANSHAHTEQYQKYHPEHWGWDYDVSHDVEKAGDSP